MRRHALGSSAKLEPSRCGVRARAVSSSQAAPSQAAAPPIHPAAEQHQPLAPLPDPATSWALITGATTGLGQALAHSCVKAGLGVILTDSTELGSLELLKKELSSADPSGNVRVVTIAANLSDPSEGARILHESLQGYDVAVLLVASDQFAYTGPFLEQPPTNLDRMLALNVGATCALVRLFGEDMAAAGRGRILLIGAPAAETPGVAGACAFAGSMAFVRALADGLRQELAPLVGVSCLESRGVGREASLDEALASTCVSFLASDQALLRNGFAKVKAREAEAQPVAGERAADAAESERPEPSSVNGEKDVDVSWNSALWREAYQQLAREQNFRPMPFGAEIDALQRSAPAEFSNAMLVGFVCTVFALKTVPGIGAQTKVFMGQIIDFSNLLFSLDYFARWWSRGLRWDYALTPTMISDLVSVIPFLLRGFVPALQGVELNFLKLFRVLRIYRFFRPGEVKKTVRLVLGPGLAEEADAIMRTIRPYQLQVARTFGIVTTLVFVTAGLMYEAENVANPQFRDFFSSFYFSIIALSTVGFGDIAPVTPAGKVAISVSIIVGLCVIPFQASLVASAVAEEERLKEEFREKSGETAETILTALEQSRAQLAWDAARIAELEGLEREERARLEALEDLEREERAQIKRLQAQLEDKIRAKSDGKWF